MGFIQKLRRHAAVAGGNFGAIFKGTEIPPLPVAVNELIREVNDPDPDIDRLVDLISSETAIAAMVITTVNSSFYSLRMPVVDIKRGITLLGLKNIRSLALSFSTVSALPVPEGDLFQHEAFWTDSLLKAFMARTFTESLYPEQAEEAFTASLLADVALPVLLSVWTEYYHAVIDEWQHSSLRLSEIERSHFGWDHAQAGAWIIQSWGFPDETVCCLGAHNLSMRDISANQLEQTIVVPMAVAALLPSVMKPDHRRIKQLWQAVAEHLGLTADQFRKKLRTIKNTFGEIIELFGFQHNSADAVFDALLDETMAENKDLV